MTPTQRKAMEQALEAFDGGSYEQLLAAAALRAALAEQPAEQQPVAFDVVCKGCGGSGLYAKDHNYQCPVCNGSGFVTEMLYTAPQPAKREPMTDEEISALWLDSISGPLTASKFARAIERAHSITGEAK